MENENSALPAISFAAEIRPLFRDKDVSAMMRARKLDLSSYDEVSARAPDILDRLETGDMPCDGSWSADKVATFRKWISDGKQP